MSRAVPASTAIPNAPTMVRAGRSGRAKPLAGARRRVVMDRTLRRARSGDARPHTTGRSRVFVLAKYWYSALLSSGSQRYRVVEGVPDGQAGDRDAQGRLGGNRAGRPVGARRVRLRDHGVAARAG